MTRTLHRVEVTNFLSLKKISIYVNDLTVLVGPNGAGKSNFLSIFRFIGEVARTDLEPAIESFGGFNQLSFRDESAKSTKSVSIKIQGVMTKFASENALDSYKIRFHQRRINQLSREILFRNEELILKRKSGRGRRITLNGSQVSVTGVSSDQKGLKEKSLKVQDSSSGLAILRRLGASYEAPQVEEIASIFEDLRLFEINVERARKPSSLSTSERLNHDGSNIASFLYFLKKEYPELLRKVEEDLQFVLPVFRRFKFTPIAGANSAVRLDLEEAGLNDATPLARASFGTIRAIALFAMLHDPNPPRLTCIEEVDHGLHPHALDRVVERLREAAERTQILVATHSPALVNRLRPAELIVFERDRETGESYIPEISSDEIAEMEKSSGLNLGELWFSGLIGGGLG